MPQQTESAPPRADLPHDVGSVVLGDLAASLGSRHYHEILKAIMVDREMQYRRNGSSFLVSTADARTIAERFNRLHRPLLRGPRPVAEKLAGE